MLSNSLLLGSLVALATAQSSSVSFAYPPKPTGTTPTLIINVVDTVIVQWKSNYKNAWLFLWCDEDFNKTTPYRSWYKLKVPASGEAPYNAFFNTSLDRKWDKTKPYDCKFDLSPVDQGDNGINGPPVEITSVKQASATTYALSYTTNVLPPSGTPTITSSAGDVHSEPTQAPSPSPIPASGGGSLSSGAIAGIAIGAVAGVAALAAIGFLVWRNCRKSKQMKLLLPAEGGAAYAAAGDYKKPPQGVDVAPVYEPYRDDTYRYGYMASPPPPEGAQLHGSQAVEMDSVPTGAPASIPPPSELPGSSGANRGAPVKK